jgi:hypothetical protein
MRWLLWVLVRISIGMFVLTLCTPVRAGEGGENEQRKGQGKDQRLMRTVYSKQSCRMSFPSAMRQLRVRGLSAG